MGDMIWGRSRKDKRHYVLEKELHREGKLGEVIASRPRMTRRRDGALEAGEEKGGMQD